MTESLKLNEMQRSSIEFERQRHLANWFIKSSPHMATPTTAATSATTTITDVAGTAATSAAGATNGAATQTAATGGTTTGGLNAGHTSNGTGHALNTSSTTALSPPTTNNNNNNSSRHHTPHNGAPPPQPVFFLISSSGNGSAHLVTSGGKHSSNGAIGVSPPPPPLSSAAAAAAAMAAGPAALGHFADGRKPKLRRYNSHDTSANMFSVADFENARLARRNEIEMKQRLQRRMRMSASGAYSGSGSSALAGSAANGFGGNITGSMSGDYSTGDSKASKYSNESTHEPLPAVEFLERHSLPCVVRISYKTKFCDETLQSSSSNGSSSASTSMSTSSTGVGAAGLNGVSTTPTGTGSSTSTASSSGHKQGTGNANTSAGSVSKAQANSSPQLANGAHESEQDQEQGELFLLYRLVRQRHIYHGHNTKTAAASRKKGVLIPQEFPGYFSLLNDKGLPTATQYTSLIQLVRERVFKFVSVDNMPAFTESQSNVSASSSTPADGCLPMYTSPPPPPSNNRPQYVKTTARGGQVFRLLAVFEDGKQDHATIGCAGGVTAKASAHHGREKEKGRYAQLLNENRQVLYVPLSTKGKFYEIEPGVPQILQKLSSSGFGSTHEAGIGAANGAQKKLNPDCVHRITALVTPARELPLTLRYISGPSGNGGVIPESVCITRIHTENVIIACPIEDVCGSAQSPLKLRKLHLTKEMNLLKHLLGFESEQRMLANPNVQNILKFCQFNCDQLLKAVEVELLQRPERSGSKSRVEGLKLLKPLHLPKLLRREKTTIPAHEKEDSIIFLSKTDLANLEAKEAAQQAAYERDAAAPGGNANANGNRLSEKMKVFQSTKKKWFRKQDKHAPNSLTTFELDVQAKRMSMERYTDVSKLLQERFGDKPHASSNGTAEQELHSVRSGASDIGSSDTETTTLATIDEKLKQLRRSSHKVLTQKSMSLQDIELISGSERKPDLLTDTISEAGTDVDDIENQAPMPQSFITEKLYNEFHVKTRQYSKSSSSLHQLLNFSLPQKLQLHDNKRSLAQLKAQQKAGFERRLDFNIGEPVTGRRAAGGISLLAGGGGQAITPTGNGSQQTSLLSPLSLIDDLPYSSVRDSLVLSSDESGELEQVNGGGNICQALHLIDYTKENIYAEICHDANGMATVVSTTGQMPNSQTRDTYSSETHSTQLSDDYGDYASLTYAAQATSGTTGAQAISRVHINCSSSPVSYHTVYLGDEPLGEQHHHKQQFEMEKSHGKREKSEEPRGRGTGGGGGHVTTVALAGGEGRGREQAPPLTDNIYNTLK